MVDNPSQAGPSSGATHRPRMKRVRHTWHGEVTYRSHFEDFMREIGVDAREHHLCCLPRQATIQTHRRTKSEPVVPKSTDGRTPASATETDRQQSHAQHINSHHHSATSEASSSRKASSSPTRFLRNTVGPVASKLKASAAAPAVYTQYHTASSLYPSISVEQELQFLMGPSLVVRPRQEAIMPTVSEEQEPWFPLPTPPAFSSAKKTAIPSPRFSFSVRPFSRVPSFASLDTISSSEGPETPLGHSPLPSPAREMSPTLSYLEQISKVRVPALCVTCQKTGQNFPSCPSCGDTWCSRECRVQGSQGKRHTCQKSGAAPMVAPMGAVAT